MSSSPPYAPYAPDGHDLRLFLGPARGSLDESTIVGAWVPGAGWADMSSTVLRGSVAIEHDGVGFTASFTVETESRQAWQDDLAVAIVARMNVGGGGFGTFFTVCWGYLDGSDRQTLGLQLLQTGTRYVTYHGYWDRRNVPALRVGRRNLSDGASVTSSTVLADPTLEVPLEYRSQDDCAAAKIVDQDADTCGVLAVLADPARPALGDADFPQILRVFPDLTGAPAVEVWCGHNVTPWGSFDTPTAIPALEGSGTNTRNDTVCQVSYPSGRMQVEAKAQPGNPYQMHGPQWNIWLDARPFRVTFRYKAAEAGSVGKALHVTHGGGATVTLGLDWQDYDYSADGATNGLLVLRFQGGDNNNPASNLATRTLFEIEDLRVAVGYSDMFFQGITGYKLSLASDDGLGHEVVVRVAGNIAPWEDWRIPADDSVIFAFNPAEFNARFDAGHRTVYALRTAMPNVALKPPPTGARFKLCFASSAIRDDYDHASLTTVQEIIFNNANGGVAWQPHQALVRKSPTGTGFLTPEEHPRVGLFPDTLGSGYWAANLGPYRPTYLALPVPAGATTVAVADAGEFPASGTASVAGDTFTYTGVSGDTLTGVSGILAHSAGDAVTPVYGGVPQGGWFLGTVELRRKPGTPVIQAGAVLYSPATAPTNPAVPDGLGARWERQADWDLVARWDYGAATTIPAMVWTPPLVQCRHVAVVIDRMARAAGLPQRAKLNELLVTQYQPGGGRDGNWAGTGALTVGDVVAHLLVTYGPVPAAKVDLDAGGFPPVGDLPIAPATLARTIDALGEGGLVSVWLDNLNRAAVEATPASPRFYRPAIALTLTADLCLAPVGGDWAVAHTVAQVRVTARDVASLRTYVVRYPTRAAALGEVVDIGPVFVRSAQEARDVADAGYRARAARRRYSVTIGAAPWLRPRQRVLIDLPDLDPSGQHVGVNTVVESFQHRIESQGGLIVWTTSVTLAEWAL